MSKETFHYNSTCKESDKKFICQRCQDTGVWRYDENHGQPCPDCCLHSEGVWMLTYEYGDEGMWCCRAGCGTKWEGIVDYQKKIKGVSR